MAYYFTTDKLSVGYQGVPLIENIKINLKQGEILTLIGPNGAGKSTILKSIAGQLKPLGGCILLEGENLKQLSGNELARKMAVMLTKKQQAELMTCEEVVAAGRYPYTGRFGILSKEDHEKVREAMELVQAAELANLDFQQVSDGQRQRILLARAICQEPELILLDEPTSYLDIRYKLEFLSVLQEMTRKKKVTVILSLHELELAEKISDRILCIKGHCVDRIGRPQEVFVPGYLSELFGMTKGSFQEINANMELPAPEGIPKTFVIAGGGSGQGVYRRLQREGIAFITGILYENDLDYPVATALAAKVYAAKSFEPMEQALFESASQALETCERLICCRKSFGKLEWGNIELLKKAKGLGKTVEWEVGKDN